MKPETSMNKNHLSRRGFLGLGAQAGMLGALSSLGLLAARPRKPP